MTSPRSSPDRLAWTEPVTEPVAPGVHRVPLPLPQDGLRAVNVYVLETSDGLVLVDGGWSLPESEQRLAEGLARLGAGLGDIRRFLVTHVHRDHYTQAVALRGRTGATVGLGAGERPTLELLNGPGHAGLDTQVVALRRCGAGDLADLVAGWAGTRPPDPGLWAMPDQWLTEGPVPLDGGRVLTAVATPGHTSGHLVFHDEAAELLFAGDHVLPFITPSIGFEPVPSASPLRDFLSSLALVRTRPDARLLPAHGPVAPSVHARVDELLEHHDRRLAETLTVVTGQGFTAHEAAGRLTWTRRLHRLPDLDPFNTMLAVLETAAHLEVLVAQGRVLRDPGTEGAPDRFR